MNVTNPSILGGYTIKAIMDTWTLQEGYPLLTVTRNYANNSALLSQKRFLLEPYRADQISSHLNPSTLFRFQWYIPFNYMNTSRVSFLDWLAPNETRTVNDIASSNEWIVFNVHEFGFYRVNYDERNWQLLTSELKNDRNRFSVITRAQLIDDAFNLARSMDLNVAVPFHLSTYLCNEIDYIPYSAFSTNIQYPLIMFSRNENKTTYRQLQTFIHTLEQSMYDKLGWTIVPTSSDYFSRQLRSLVIGDLCANGYIPCVNSAISQYRQWRLNSTATSINPDFRTTVYCQGIKHGTTTDYEHIRQEYEQTNDEVEKYRLGYALTCSQNTTLLNQLLNSTLTNEYIRLHDASTFISHISIQPTGQNLTWRFISERWSELVAKYGGIILTLPHIVESVLQYMNTERELADIEKFMVDTADLSIAKRAFLLSIEKIRANIQWMNTVGSDIQELLANNSLRC
ncbi:unnamed protein product [Rotaria sordida]|uniref:Aminopeptidase N n=1 Tax=Rotaria sordida TaxID=392033 RepID=A0A819ASE6_9BILA|nr:unnamed protein product [Rotaria sordida]CAF3788812.1 unnamed protein product [Rotaria sordida]